MDSCFRRNDRKDSGFGVERGMPVRNIESFDTSAALSAGCAQDRPFDYAQDRHRRRNAEVKKGKWLPVGQKIRYNVRSSLFVVSSI
jgi:hypothetical protein